MDCPCQPALSSVVMASAPCSPAVFPDALSVSSECASVVTVLDSVETVSDDDILADPAGMDCAAVSDGDASASEASGPWAAGWVPACPPGLVQCPHCMMFVPPALFCEYCLSQLGGVSSEEDVAVADGAAAVVSSGASTALPRSSSTELDSSWSDSDSVLQM